MKSFFYFDLDNIDNVFLGCVLEAIFKNREQNEVFLKFYSSDLKKSFFSKELFGDRHPSVEFSVFDLGGRKIFGKEAVDRVVSMDVMNDISSLPVDGIGFVSNDYDFYGTLLFVDKVFCIDLDKCFFCDKGRLNIPNIKSGISILEVNTKDKRKELKIGLANEISKLGVRYNGNNSVEMYSALAAKGVDVKKHIGNNSFSLFLKTEYPNLSVFNRDFSGVGF